MVAPLVRPTAEAGTYVHCARRHANATSSDVYFDETLMPWRPVGDQRVGDPVPMAPPPADVDEEKCWRHTSTQRAVVDLFTCAAAFAFKGTYYSSFSDAIQRLRLSRRRQS